jgi:hypothetical protein
MTYGLGMPPAAPAQQPWATAQQRLSGALGAPPTALARLQALMAARASGTPQAMAQNRMQMSPHADKIGALRSALPPQQMHPPVAAQLPQQPQTDASLQQLLASMGNPALTDYNLQSLAGGS